MIDDLMGELMNVGVKGRAGSLKDVEVVERVDNSQERFTLDNVMVVVRFKSADRYPRSPAKGRGQGERSNKVQGCIFVVMASFN